MATEVYRHMNSHTLRTHKFQSDDPDEVSDFIGRIYAENQFKAQHDVRRDVCMTGLEWNGIGVYDVDYLMPFNFDSNEAPSNYLFLTCHRGYGMYEAGKSGAVCSPGDVMPISSTESSSCRSGPGGFGHLSVIIDAERLNLFLSRWTGRHIVQPVKFELATFAPELNTQWNLASACLQQMMRISPMPEIAIEALLEHMLGLLVTHHPHSYSALLSSDRCASEQQTLAAIARIRRSPRRCKTLGSIAHALGCPTHALERGIRRATGKSFAELRGEALLSQVNRALASNDHQRFLEVLTAHGFTATERFFLDYERRFAEPPDATYRRNPNAVEVLSPADFASRTISKSEIDRRIDEAMEGRFSTADIGRLIGRNERATVAAFKQQFSQTPKRYVIERRLEHARWMLENTSESILAIALYCGFGNQSYLATAVKRQFGTTPSEIRRMAALARKTSRDVNQEKM